MKILDKPSQILNVRNTTSQCHSHQVHQTKTKYPNQNTKYAKQDTKYAKQNTKYAKQNTKYAKQNTKYAKQNTKYAKQNTKYAKQNTKYAISIKRVRQKIQICQKLIKFAIFGLKCVKILIYAVLIQGNFSHKFTHFLAYLLQA